METAPGTEVLTLRFLVGLIRLLTWFVGVPCGFCGGGTVSTARQSETRGPIQGMNGLQCTVYGLAWH